MLWGAEKLVPAEYWCPYGTLLYWDFVISVFFITRVHCISVCCFGIFISLEKDLAIGDFHNVFKFHAYSVNKRSLTTAKLVRGLSDVATTNVCKVDTSNRNHIERSRWMKWLITGLRQKKYPFIWIHYEIPLLLDFISSGPCSV